jgi:pseudouridine kinase
MNAVDWGSGPNPLGAELLGRRGIETLPWDPLFAHRQTPWKDAFDLVLCIETAEHFAEPRRDFRSIADCLKPGGWAFVHTHIAPQKDDDFLGWWYIQDITHLSFYSERSLRILSDIGSLAFIALEENNLAVLRRPLPALIAGGINLDIEGRPYRELILRDSNPGKVCFSPGGCGRNIAENLSRLGLGTELISVVGDDVFGQGLKESAQAAGIGISGVAADKGKVTSTYLSLLDNYGDMTAAVSGMDIFDGFTPEHAEPAVDRAVTAAYSRCYGANRDAPFSKLFVDGNLLPETSLYLQRRFPDLPCWLDPVSVTKTRRIAEYQQGKLFSGLEGLKLNLLEIQALLGDIGYDPHTPEYLEKLCRAIARELPGTVYVTLGSGGVLRVDRAGAVRFKGPAIEPRSTTGAGDAFLGASLRRRILGTPEAAEDVIAGSAAAYLTLQSPQAVSADLTAEVLESLILQWNQQAQGRITIV